MSSHKPGNVDYALDIAASMADSESDLETDGLELALDTLCSRHCSDESSLKSKEYCSEFCELVEEYTGQWQVPLPQLKVLRTALNSFTKATAPFPDDCQHIHYVLSSLALSFFELLLFFGKEEFVEDPLKDIIDCFQECHAQLLRHRNSYLHQVKHIIKSGGPWENPVLQKILKEADLQPNEVEEYLSSQLPVFLELRVRYLQACERLKEAMALSKSCLENHEAGKHLFFHQAYLTCLYKASLHEHLHKEMAEIDGRDAVEIICNTERVEKDEVLLSLCKAFLTQYLHNGDMYYIWDLLFIWSRLHLRAHPSTEGFLAECLLLASSATNVRAIFPFIKLVTTEVGGEGVEVCLELCARALQLCDAQDDSETRSLVCKTIAFLLPHDLEICRASALLAFCQERSLEAYRTVCLLYMHPDEEPHPHNSTVRTNVRFHILQLLKERLCFDPEFWNLLTLRTYCLELLNDNVIKAVVLSEMKEEEEKQLNEEVSKNSSDESCTREASFPQSTEAPPVSHDLIKEQDDNCAEKHVSPPKRALWPVKKVRKRGRPRKQVPVSDDEAENGDDPEYKYTLKSTCLVNKPFYSLRRSKANMDVSGSTRSTLNQSREYLSRCVKNQILNRKGRRRLWLPVLPKECIVFIGKKRGRKPFARLEYFYPDNEILLSDEGPGSEEVSEREVGEPDFSEEKENNFLQTTDHENQSELRENSDLVPVKDNEQITDEPLVSEAPAPAVEGDPELDGPPLKFLECPVESLHCYCLIIEKSNSDHQGPEESSVPDELNGDIKPEPCSPEETGVSNAEQKTKRTWKEKLLRTQQFSHMKHHCSICGKDYKGLNIMRHAISHLKRRRLKCILCGKRFKHVSFAKKHILDHFDKMCKEKEPCVEEPPAVNGLVENKEQQTETQISQEEVQRKTATKIRVSDLSREQRIIRNIRTLVKKTALLHKKCTDPESDFQDDQVVIEDGQVFIKVPSVTENSEGGEQGNKNAEGENGVDVVRDTYYLCPSESCDRVFLRSNNTLIRHAIKSHINEESVLEKTFVWANKKCKLCFRQLQFLQHYKEHMKFHDDPLQHFCYHLECNQRFGTQQELKDHIATHNPFQPQCRFMGCEKLFSNLQSLYDHEWRHYNPAPQRDELEHGGRKEVQNPEAPWKQRLKVEELWLQVKKDKRDSPNPEHAAALPVEKLGGVTKGLEESCEVSDENMSGPSENGKPLTNGHEKESEFPSADDVSATETSPTAKCQNKPLYEPDPLNVKEAINIATMVEGVQQKLGEPHITEHKTFKPEDPVYATFVKAPFVRPPPCTYLNESVLSMRKRRPAEEQQVVPRKTVNWNHRKKKDLEKQQEPEDKTPEPKVRHRCSKCLSSYASLKELQQHEALNTCSSLFGFDSDDES